MPAYNILNDGVNNNGMTDEVGGSTMATAIVSFYSCLTKTVSLAKSDEIEIAEVARAFDFQYDFEDDYTSSNTTSCPVITYTLTSPNSDSDIDISLKNFVSISQTKVIIKSSYRGQASFAVKGSNDRNIGAWKIFRLNFTDIVEPVETNKTESSNTTSKV